MTAVIPMVIFAIAVSMKSRWSLLIRRARLSTKTTGANANKTYLMMIYANETLNLESLGCVVSLE